MMDMLFIIIEGHPLCGKSFISNKLKDLLSNEGYVTCVFDETGIINECITNGHLSVYDLFGVREQKYAQYMDCDILIVEKSFLSNIILNLQHLPDDMIHDFITYELDHYTSFGSSLQMYTLFRNYENELVDVYLGLSHYLLETYAVDISCLANSRDENTEGLLNHIVERVKWELDVDDTE